MNCRHVLGLIDAGPLADYPPAHLAAAWRHARACPTCGPALEMSTVMTRELAGGLHTEPPAHFAVGVAARIARLEAPSRSRRDASRARRTAAVGWWSGLSTVVGGVVAGVALMASLPPGGWTLQRFAMLWGGWLEAGAILPPASPGGALVMAAGVLLFVVGLFYGRDFTERSP